MGPARRTAPRPNPRTGKASALVAALGLVMVAGTLYGLWELTGGLPGNGAVPLEPVDRAGGAPAAGTGGETALHPTAREGGARAGLEGAAEGSGPRGAASSPGDSRSSDSPEPARDGPTLRSELATVARTFRTANPDLRGLNDLVRRMAAACTVLDASVERESGRVRGIVQLAGTDLEGTFTIEGERHRVLFVETSYDTVHPPYTGIELDLSFATPRRALTDVSARLSFVPNLSRKALDHIAAGSELRIGWSVTFDADGASARGIGAWVADDLEGWRVAPSDTHRKDGRVRDLSSFEAWRRLLAGR